MLQDLVEAARPLLALAAAQGHEVAQCKLGSFYAKGIGVAQDFRKALRLSRPAAARGNSRRATWSLNARATSAASRGSLVALPQN